MIMEDDQRNLCEDYLELKPQHASCLDFVRILCWCDITKRDFFDTSEEGGVKESFRHRWVVFISVSLQKICLGLKRPVAFVGWVVEMLLNYPNFNGGLHKFIFNLMTGRLVKPDKISARFTSMVGNLDKRTELETEISSGDKRYNASLAIMASKLSYENEAFVQNVVTNHWQMKFLEFKKYRNDFEEENWTHSFMFQDKTTNPNLVVVAFRGTEPFTTETWQTDVDISWYKFHSAGKVHGGFAKALGMPKTRSWPTEMPLDPTEEHPLAYYYIRERIRALMNENENAKFVLTGHSLGGALAILFAGVLAIHKEKDLLDRLEGVYTFGQPRVGDKEFGVFMNEIMDLRDVKYYRYVYCNDMVPRLPYDDKTFMFKHFGDCLYFNSSYSGQVMKEEPNKNYFSMLHVVPKILNAVYELIRSFILPWREGSEYREGWVMKVFRVTALLIPGLTDHFPVDYVNLTRLGKFISTQGNSKYRVNLKQK